MKELVEKVTKIRLRASLGKKNPKVQKSSIIMATDYGHVSKNFGPVFVGSYSPNFVFVLKKITSFLNRRLTVEKSKSDLRDPLDGLYRFFSKI